MSGCSKINTILSVAAVVASVASLGFTVYKTNPDVVYNSIMKNIEKKQQKEMNELKEKANSYIKSITLGF